MALLRIGFFSVTCFHVNSDQSMHSTIDCSQFLVQNRPSYYQTLQLSGILNMNVNLNLGGLFGGLLGAGIMALIMLAVGGEAETRRIAKAIIAGVVVGALAGNFIWAWIFPSKPTKQSAKKKRPRSRTHDDAD